MEEKINKTTKEYEEKARQVVGEKFMNGVVPIVGFIAKGESTIHFSHGQSVTIQVKPDKIGVNYSLDF